MEKILCAAIWYDNGDTRPHLPKNINSGIVVGGYRHPSCLSSLASILYPNWQTISIEDMVRIDCLNKQVQGFITNKNRFVNRKEAAEIAIASGQVTQVEFPKTGLHSEDLY